MVANKTPIQLPKYSISVQSIAVIETSGYQTCEITFFVHYLFNLSAINVICFPSVYFTYISLLCRTLQYIRVYWLSFVTIFNNVELVSTQSDLSEITCSINSPSRI